jgi:hypothetical protein
MAIPILSDEWADDARKSKRRAGCASRRKGASRHAFVRSAPELWNRRILPVTPARTTSRFERLPDAVRRSLDAERSNRSSRTSSKTLRLGSCWILGALRSRREMSGSPDHRAGQRPAGLTSFAKVEPSRPLRIDSGPSHERRASPTA